MAQCGLRGAVGAGVGVLGVGASAGDVDDRAGPVGTHPRKHRLSPDQRSAHVDVQHVPPLVQLHVGDGSHGHPPGVVDQHIDATEALHALSHGTLSDRRIRDVADNDLHGACGAGQQRRRLLQPLS